MKYLVLLCDGMADTPAPQLGGRTPMEAANKPHMDRLAGNGELGTVRTVAPGLKPGSDVANLSVLGYDPHLYYTGRSPLEAASIGVAMSESDLATRCNLVTLSEEEPYTAKTMIDYCSDDISTAEADQLIRAVDEAFRDRGVRFYTGVSYRHCMISPAGDTDPQDSAPPHDILDQPIAEHLPGEFFLSLMADSYAILKDHPVNQARIAKGKRPANSIWLWGSGKKLSLPPFRDKYGISGAMVSAVDLLKGIAILSGMQSIDVPGATGYIDTNFTGKATAALNAWKEGADLVYLHLEAPDECGHRGEAENKVRALELIDSLVLGPILEGLAAMGEPYGILIMPDHPTPLAIRTHSADPVPYLIYHSEKDTGAAPVCFCEKAAAESGILLEDGCSQILRMMQK
ncbi:MAG: cofactor-independent phosphoglycerate mutase [Ruminococcaceae bacterium]|nr:cofactor-independent phosphoglycerate mutase [Oscillospiraceae bacterium]